MSTTPARNCAAQAANEVLRAYIGSLTRNERRAVARRHFPSGDSDNNFTVPLTGNDGAIVYSGWELHAIAGDLLKA